MDDGRTAETTGSKGWPPLLLCTVALACMTLPRLCDPTSFAGSAPAVGGATLAGLALWAVYALVSLRSHREPPACADEVACEVRRPVNVRHTSQGTVLFRLQGGLRKKSAPAHGNRRKARDAVQQCTARWWDEADNCLVLESSSGKAVLAIPWATVTAACLDICGDVDADVPVTLLLECRPVLQEQKERVAKPMLVKLYVTDYADVKCLRACLVSSGVSKTRKLWSWLGHDWVLWCGYHRYVRPTLLCELSHKFHKVLGVCTMLAALSQMLQWLGGIRMPLAGDLLAAVDTPVWVCGALVGVAASLCCLGRHPVRSVFALCVAALVCGAGYLLLLLGSLRAAAAEAYPAFGRLESALLLSGPASKLLFRTLPSGLMSVKKALSFDLCHPKHPVSVKLLSVFVRAWRYSPADAPRYVYHCLTDAAVMALVMREAEPEVGYRTELYALMATDTAQRQRGYRYQADVLLSCLEAYNFHGWGDVLSSACLHRCHHVLGTVLRRWAARSDVEAAILIAAGRGDIDVLTTLHEHLGAHDQHALPVRGADGRTVLHTAAVHGHKDAVKKMLDKYKKAFVVEAGDRTASGLTALHCASLAGKDDVAKWLLSCDPAHTWMKTPDGRTVMHCAAAGGAVKLVKHIEAMSRDVGSSDATAALLAVTRDGCTPLHCAAEKGKHEAVKLLLESLPEKKRAQLKARTSRGWTALHCACATPTASDAVAETVKLLLESGADLHATTCGGERMQGDTALQLALDCGNGTLADLLVRAAKDKTRCVKSDRHGRTLLHRAASVDCVKVILRHFPRASFDALALDGQSVLHCAAEKGLWDVYSEFKRGLSEQGVAVPLTTKDGLTCLHFAAQGGHPAVVSRLMEEHTEAGDYQATSTHGDTPLHLAAREGHDRVVSKLLGTEAGRTAVGAADKDGYTPLHLAAKRGSVAATRELLRVGARTGAQSNADYTPLHLATTACVAELLIEKGADVHALGQGKTPQKMASQRGDAAVADLLAREMKVNTQFAEAVGCDGQSACGSTPLHLAAQLGHLEKVTILLEHDAAASGVQDAAGLTPLHHASTSGHVETVKELLRHNLEACGLETEDGLTPLHLAAANGHVEAARILLEHHDEARAVRYTSVLHCAATNGHVATTNLLLEHKLKHNPDACGVQDEDGDTPLHRAAVRGHAETAALLLNRDARACGVQNNSGRTPLHCAAMEGHLKTTMLLLEKRYDTGACDATDEEGSTPLHWAARRGHLEAVKELLKHSNAGASVAKDGEGRTPLYRAAWNGHTATVAALLEHNGAASDVPGKEGRTPLHCAAMSGKAETAAMLLKHNAESCNVKNSAGQTPLHCAAKRKHTETVRVLAKHEAATCKVKDNCGQTPLHLAVIDGHADTAEMLVKHNADACGMQDRTGRTPLHYTATDGNVRTAMLLLESFGTGLCGVLNNNGSTPLHAAAYAGRAEMVQLLLKFDTTACTVLNKYIGTPLHYAAWVGHVGMIQALLEHNTEVCGTQNINGGTPLHSAAWSGHVEAVTLLLQYNAEACVLQNKRGRTPLLCAARGGYTDIVKLLLDANKKAYSFRSDTGFTPLCAAANNGHVETVKVLLQHSTDACVVTNNNGSMPLHTAAWNGHLKVVEVLLKHSPNGCCRALNTHVGTPLHNAARNGHLSTVEFLWNHDAAANDVRSNTGSTPLHTAAWSGRVETVRFLLRCGVAACSVENRKGRTPLHCAAQNGHTETVKVLLEHSKEACNMEDKEGRKPWKCASDNEHLETLHLLV